MSRRRTLAAVAAAAAMALVPACGEEDVEGELRDRAVPDDVQRQIDDAQEQGEQLREQGEQLQEQGEQLQENLQEQVPQQPGE